MVARLALLLVVAGCGGRPAAPPAPAPSAPAVAPTPTPDAGLEAAPLAAIAAPSVPVCTDPIPRAGLCGCLIDALPMDVDDDSAWDDCELDDDPVAGWTVARLDSATEDAAILVRERPAGWVAVTELERAVYTGRGSDNSYEIGELKLVDIPGGAVLIADHAGIDYWMQEIPSGDDDDDDDDSGDDGDDGDDDPPVSEGGTRIDSVTLCPFAGAAAPARCTSFAVDVAGLDDDLPPEIDMAYFAWEITGDILELRHAGGTLAANDTAQPGRYRLLSP